MSEKTPHIAQKSPFAVAVEAAIQALNLGAYRYVVKTDTLVEELHLTVERALGGDGAARREYAAAPRALAGICRA